MGLYGFNSHRTAEKENGGDKMYETIKEACKLWSCEPDDLKLCPICKKRYIPKIFEICAECAPLGPIEEYKGDIVIETDKNGNMKMFI